MHVLHGTFRHLNKLVLLAGALVGLGFSLAYAVPVQGMEPQGRDHSTARTASPLAAVTGAASVFGVDEGGALIGDPTARNLAVATGARWTRVALSWSSLEPSPGVYNFVYSDGVINTLLNAGLSPVVYIADNPTWAANTSCGPIDTTDPTKVKAFGDLMSALAARYTNVQIWALYNEIDNTSIPNGPSTAGCFGAFGKGGANDNGIQDFKEYATLLATAWQAVHSANPSPSVRLASGSLAYDNFDPRACPPQYPGNCAGGTFNYKFPNKLYRFMKKHPLANGNKYMDLVLFNYYEIYGRYWETVAPGNGIQAKAEALRKRMKGKVPMLDLFVTETGEASDWIGVKGQAKCLDIIFTRGLAADLKGMVWWTFKDLPSKNWYFGIVDANLNPKLAYTSFQILSAELNGYQFDRNLSGKTGYSGAEAYRFRSASSTKFVVWSSLIKSSSYQPNCSWLRKSTKASFNATSLRVVSYTGHTVTIADNSKKDKDKTSGRMEIKVGGNPKIVELNP